MQLTVSKTPLDGLFVIEPKVFKDERGFFFESWSKKDFADNGIVVEFVQDNHSRSTKGTLRGLHYQDMSAPLTKLVRCSVGQILDVAVDLRLSSPTFGAHYATMLSSDNFRQMYIPVGFAHGFVTLSDVAELQYKQTGYYTPSAEGGIIWNDVDIAIDWSIENPLLSERDQRLVTFQEYKTHPIFT